MRTRHRVVLSSLVLGAAIAFPLGVIASHQFSDVPAAHPYHTDIDALVDSGVTTGCGGGKYCPSAFVTREQMAAFMNRLGALQAGKTPVVNAAKVDGHDEVLPAEDIVVDQMGPWFTHPFLAPGVTISHFIEFTSIVRDDTGDANILLRLQAPGTIGGVTYGLASVEVCYGEPASPVTITRTSVGQVVSVHATEYVIDDDTDRQLGFPAACYTVTDPTPSAPTGASTLNLELHLVKGPFPDDPAFENLGNIRSTWTPVN